MFSALVYKFHSFIVFSTFVEKYILLKPECFYLINFGIYICYFQRPNPSLFFIWQCWLGLCLYTANLLSVYSAVYISNLFLGFWSEIFMKIKTICSHVIFFIYKGSRSIITKVWEEIYVNSMHLFKFKIVFSIYLYMDIVTSNK